MASPNRDSLLRVARGLGPLLNDLVFVGGQAAELLVTDSTGIRPRPTEDSDVVCEVAGYGGYVGLGQQLRSLGFSEDSSRGAPLCRWRLGADVLDVMPADESVLGFNNAWYPLAMREASPFQLEPAGTPDNSREPLWA